MSSKGNTEMFFWSPQGNAGPMQGSKEVFEEEIYGSDEEIEDDDGDGSKMPRRILSGRGITLNMLINDGILSPGDGYLTIDYLGTKFVGDLLPEGKIRWQQSKEVFSSPSAWAIHCKKLLNPDRKPGCGWSSIKYRGRKLDYYKSMWFKKYKRSHGGSPLPQQIIQGFTSVPSTSSYPSRQTLQPLFIEEEKKEVFFKKPIVTERSTVVISQSQSGERLVVNHSLIGVRCPDHDTSTLVLSTPFSSLERIQPFTVTIATNCLLLVDFHCHLTQSEVVGYLGGTWDIASHNLAILQAFPCKSKLGDKDTAQTVEEEIRQSLDRRNLILVGWYHSHPSCVPQPSIRDIESQMEYQIVMKGDCDSAYTPCLGLICSPYNKDKKHLEADYLAYWVMPPPEHRPNDYGRPMQMMYNIANDSFLTQDLLMEMRQLADFYRGMSDSNNFKLDYRDGDVTVTLWDKLKSSLTLKLPRDLQVSGGQPAAHLQAVNHFWEFVKGLILS